MKTLRLLLGHFSHTPLSFVIVVMLMLPLTSEAVGCTVVGPVIWVFGVALAIIRLTGRGNSGQPCWDIWLTVAAIGSLSLLAQSISQLCLYFRIFRAEKQFCQVINIAIGLVVLWGTVFLLNFVFLCDLALEDQMSTSKKISVIVIFALGVGFVFLFRIDWSANFTGSSKVTFILITVELAYISLRINLPEVFQACIRRAAPTARGGFSSDDNALVSVPRKPRKGRADDEYRYWSFHEGGHGVLWQTSLYQETGYI
ncbi:uncharacterized protein B0I36DRAFT_356005 [Microdochium trichocladiopsis]|uniref:Uncharacterized protein n=1 Tax=Microdochium trichocladiopsis TaxID=1682393 RepID=A0A9P8XT62_9PEZI|nr:uncharacterized protein B0I36DRAFT_356005 [Microdochium trichocladiopsis]KAH7012611.1 hypothetical protein B0I36DRAFT_356005 [Microdochium trichocladiopsis]